MEYDGAQLAFAMTNGSVLRRSRAVGTSTIYDNGVVHGVSELRLGVRYAPFVRREPTQTGRKQSGHKIFGA